MHMKVAAVLDLKIEKYDMTANDQLENNQVDLLVKKRRNWNILYFCLFTSNTWYLSICCPTQILDYLIMTFTCNNKVKNRYNCEKIKGFLKVKISC